MRVTEAIPIDTSLIEATGKQASFPAIYHEYKNLVRSILFRVSPDGDIDDLTQETFLKVWLGLNNFNGRATLKTWIYRVALNVAHDATRKRKHRLVQISNFDDLPATESSTLDPDQKAVRDALLQLNFKYRAVLVLTIYEELTIAEVADVLRVAEGTIKSRLHYAKKKMYLILQSFGVKL